MNARTVIESPVGPLYIEASTRGLCRLAFGTSKKFQTARQDEGSEQVDRAASAMLERALRQLDEYFAGTRRDFDLPLDIEGTPFRMSAWDAIARIPYAETISYAGLAGAAGSPNAFRAAGAACGANPVAIVVPCHRVVGSDRGLHGFGGGLPLKRWLLDHEASNLMAEAARSAGSTSKAIRAKQPALI